MNHEKVIIDYLNNMVERAMLSGVDGNPATKEEIIGRRRQIIANPKSAIFAVVRNAAEDKIGLETQLDKVFDRGFIKLVYQHAAIRMDESHSTLSDLIPGWSVAEENLAAASFPKLVAFMAACLLTEGERWRTRRFRKIK